MERRFPERQLVRIAAVHEGEDPSALAQVPQRLAGPTRRCQTLEVVQGCCGCGKRPHFETIDL